MPQNIIDKIWSAHVVASQSGAPDILFIDLHLIHEVTSPQAFAWLSEKKLPLLFPALQVATLDHSVPTDRERKNYPDDMARKQVSILRQNCQKHGIRILDFDSGGQGIVHVIGPEQGLTTPGKTIVCGDSHTSTHGAFGALGFGIGTTQVAHVFATQCLLLTKPKTMQINLHGTPSKYFSAKDAILKIISQLGIQGGTGYAIEYTGKYIEKLSMAGRLTICNMSIECGAQFGLISPDQTTLNYLREHHSLAPSKKQEKDWLQWASVPQAHFDKKINIDLTGCAPMVSWGISPEQTIPVNENIPDPDQASPDQQLSIRQALQYNGLRAGAPLAGTPIDYVFMGSCTNSRLEDLRVIGQVLKNNKVAKNVTALIVPGSEKTQKAAEAEGLADIFVAAGAQWRQAGCSMCIAMNADVVPANKRCASTSNRNFMGRQGPGSFTHLMSPRLAAMAAVTGKITNPDTF